MPALTYKVDGTPLQIATIPQGPQAQLPSPVSVSNPQATLSPTPFRTHSSSFASAPLLSESPASRVNEDALLQRPRRLSRPIVAHPPSPCNGQLELDPGFQAQHPSHLDHHRSQRLRQVHCCSLPCQCPCPALYRGRRCKHIT